MTERYFLVHTFHVWNIACARATCETLAQSVVLPSPQFGHQEQCVPRAYTVCSNHTLRIHVSAWWSKGHCIVVGVGCMFWVWTSSVLVVSNTHCYVHHWFSSCPVRIILMPAGGYRERGRYKEEGVREKKMEVSTEVMLCDSILRELEHLPCHYTSVVRWLGKELVMPQPETWWLFFEGCTSCAAGTWKIRMITQVIRCIAINIHCGIQYVRLPFVTPSTILVTIAILNTHCEMTQWL